MSSYKEFIDFLAGHKLQMVHEEEDSNGAVCLFRGSADVSFFSVVQKVLCRCFEAEVPMKISRRYFPNNDGTVVQGWMVVGPQRQSPLWSRLMSFLQKEGDYKAPAPLIQQRVEYAAKNFSSLLMQQIMAGGGVRPIFCSPSAGINQITDIHFSCSDKGYVEKVFSVILSACPWVLCEKRYVVREKEPGVISLAQFYRIFSNNLDGSARTLIQKSLERYLKISDNQGSHHVDRALFFELRDGKPVPSGPRNIPSSGFGEKGMAGAHTATQKNANIDMDSLQEIKG